MRLIFKHINTIALFIGVCFSINAQDNKSLDTSSIIIPPLDVVIEAAIRNSPTLKVHKLQNQELKQELKVEKNHGLITYIWKVQPIMACTTRL